MDGERKNGEKTEKMKIETKRQNRQKPSRPHLSIHSLSMSKPKPIRIALECYGSIRCAFHHNHIEHFFNSFPFLQNTDEIQVDVFLLMTQQDRQKTYLIHDELMQKLQTAFGNRICGFQIFEELSEDIQQYENKLAETWNHTKKEVCISPIDKGHFFQEIFKGMDIQGGHGMRAYHLEELFKYLMENETIELEQDSYVPRLYYRRMMANRIRQQYQHSNPSIKYDWVFMARIFDIDYDISEEDKLRMGTLFTQPPEPNAVYVSIDNIVAGTPVMIDAIYESLGLNYPIATFDQQWSLTDPESKRFQDTYLKMDDYLYYSRRDMTLSSENQLLMQCLRCAPKFVHLRKGYHNHHLRRSIYLNDEAYFVPILCPFRFMS